MKDNKFLTILTDGENFIAPEISDQAEVEARARKAKDATDGTYSVLAIPLATVLAAPDMLTALIDVRDNVTSDSPEMWGRIFDAIEKAGGTPDALTPAEESAAQRAADKAAFEVCAYKPDSFEHPVLMVFIGGLQVSVGEVRGTKTYNAIRRAAGGDQNIRWLYGQTPQPLE